MFMLRLSRHMRLFSRGKKQYSIRQSGNCKIVSHKTCSIMMSSMLRKLAINKLVRCYSTSNYFITTPIFYVNAAPHLGHLYSALIADAAHCFHQQLHPTNVTLFSTGTDEHGLKVQQAAGTSNPEDVKHYCDSISSKYKELFDLYNIRYSKYIRTTDEAHKICVQLFWNVLASKDCIYKDKYSGWYSVPDETFLTERQIKLIPNPNGGEDIRISEVSGHTLEWTEEENFIFKLSSFRSDLQYWLKDETRIVPNKFHKILLSWLDDDNITNDISVSRPCSRIPWGIPVPSDPSHNVYVWLDALVSYLTVAGYPDIKMWPPSVQVVGKDILKFHGIYWPAFLMAAGLEPPHKLFVHSHWTVNDEKMSKSKKNVVDPFEKVKAYTVSGFRYFLLKEGTPHSDGNYTESKVVNMLNADLANTFGNLLNRCVGKIVNANQVYPSLNDSEYRKLLSESEILKTLSDRLSTLQDEVTDHYRDFNFYKGIQSVLGTLYECNKFFDECKPWELCKQESNRDKVTCIVHITLETLRICTIALQPIIPDICEKVFRKMNIKEERRKWVSMKPSWLDGSFSEETKLHSERVILYNKLNKQ